MVSEAPSTFDLWFPLEPKDPLLHWIQGRSWPQCPWEATLRGSCPLCTGPRDTTSALSEVEMGRQPVLPALAWWWWEVAGTL